MHATKESGEKNVVIPIMEEMKEIIAGDYTTKDVVYNAREIGIMVS